MMRPMATNDDSLSVDHMRAFLALVETSSQAGAARSLNVSQATIHRHVTRVDAHFNGGLFERGLAGGLSTRGQLVESTLRSAIAMIEHARDRLAVERPVLRVGFIRAIRPLIEQTLRALGVQPGDAQFDVRLAELPSEQQARRLRNREIDVAVCYAIEDLFEDRTGIDEVVVTEQAYALVAPESACPRGKIAPNSLSTLHYVHLPSRFSQSIASYGARWLAQNRLRPKCRIECKLATEVIAYAAAGRGYGFLPALWSTAAHDGAVFVPMPDFAKTINIAAYSLEHLRFWVTPFRRALLQSAQAALAKFP
jgi:DNA-binding transcriptional LysR family regulator